MTLITSVRNCLRRGQLRLGVRDLVRFVKRLNAVNDLGHMAGIAVTSLRRGRMFCVFCDQRFIAQFRVTLRTRHVGPHLIGDLPLHITAVHRVAGVAVDAIARLPF